MKKSDGKGSKKKSRATNSTKGTSDQSKSIVKPQIIFRKGTIGNDPIVSLPSETSRSYGDVIVTVQNKSNTDRTYTIRVGVLALNGNNVVLDESIRPGIRSITPTSLYVSKGGSGTFTLEMEPSSSGTKGIYSLIVVVLGGIASVDLIRFNND